MEQQIPYDLLCTKSIEKTYAGVRGVEEEVKEVGLAEDSVGMEEAREEEMEEEMGEEEGTEEG